MKLSARDMVPIFEGSSTIKIEVFIRKANLALESVLPKQRKRLRKIILSKITGKSDLEIADLSSDNIEEIFELLTSIYSTEKTYLQCNTLLNNLQQEPEESIQVYG